MKQSTKRVVGWGAGMGIGAALLVLIAVLVMLLTSEPAAQVDPAAGEAPVEKKAECDYPQEWIGKPADENAIKKEAKVYRILGPDSMATMDYNAERINVMTDKEGVVKEVTCG